jgi:maltose alpha-D-glucosyltransferase / alpha-amylase
LANKPIPEESLLDALRSGLPRVLPEYLIHRRWFGGKAQKILATEVLDIVPICRQEQCWYVVLVQITYENGANATYDVPLLRLLDSPPQADSDVAEVLTLRNENSTEEIRLVDALSDKRFLNYLLQAVAENASFEGSAGVIRAISTPALATIWQPSQGPLIPSLMKVEQSNSSIVYSKRLMLKIFRRLEPGINPDLEIGLFLTRQSGLRTVPPLAGHLEYTNSKGTRTSVGVLQGFIANQGDAWQFTLGALSQYYEKARSEPPLAVNKIPRDSLIEVASQAIPEEVKRRIGPYLESAALLGRRTAELHIALASELHDQAFTPERLSEAEQVSFIRSAVDLMAANFGLMRRLKDEMPSQVRLEANSVLGLEGKAQSRFQLLGGLEPPPIATRTHGDYHLGQVLFTGSDFVIIDFEGEPARSLQERRKKRSPLQDVAGMLRSFHYAAYAPLLQQAATPGQEERSEDPGLGDLGPWAFYWQKWVSATFLKTYLEVSSGQQFIPASREELELLLDVYLLNKAIYELGYELNNRPTWVRIPLEGISQLLGK